MLSAIEDVSNNRRYYESQISVLSMEEVAPGRPNVMATLGGDEGRTILLEAHTDVVTEGESSEWTYPPFAGEIVGDRIYGRGACDTKGNLAAALLAVKAIKKSKPRFKGRIVLAIPVDEEGLKRARGLLREERVTAGIAEDSNGIYIKAGYHIVSCS